MADIDIQPAAGAMGNNAPNPTQPEAPQAPAAQPQAQQSSPQALPGPILKLPAIQGLISGAPAAVSVDISDFGKTDAGKEIAKAGDALQEAGLGFFKSLSGDTGVIYNSMYVHPADLLAADKAGKLSQIAPPWNKVDHIISKSGANHPALNHKGPIAPAAATPPNPPQAATGAIQPQGKSLPARAQADLLQARIAAQNPGAPTAGPAPGASQLLNRVLKPVL